MEKYGFVYIWRDRKHKRYYIGCRWGAIDDGYICSSPWMKQGHKHRPNDFKRKILKTNIPRELLLEEEYKWLSKIKKEELGKKYYNIHNHHFGHWSTDENRKLTVIQKRLNTINSFSDEKKLKIKQKMSKSATGNKNCLGRKASDESRLKMSLSHIGQRTSLGKKASEETKLKQSMVRLGKAPWNKGKKGLQIPSAQARLNMSIAQRKRREAETSI